MVLITVRSSRRVQPTKNAANTITLNPHRVLRSSDEARTMKAWELYKENEKNLNLNTRWTHLDIAEMAGWPRTNASVSTVHRRMVAMQKNNGVYMPPKVGRKALLGAVALAEWESVLDRYAEELGGGVPESEVVDIIHRIFYHESVNPTLAPVPTSESGKLDRVLKESVVPSTFKKLNR